MTGRRPLTRWRRATGGALVSVGLATGLLMGVGTTVAHADILDDIAAEYDRGASAGNVSNFVHEAMALRKLGFKPSKGNIAALQDGWDRRPNQVPLTDALKSTIAYQRKMQAQQNAASSAKSSSGIGRQPLPPGIPADPGNPTNSGVGVGIPGGSVDQPIG